MRSAFLAVVVAGSIVIPAVAVRADSAVRLAQTDGMDRRDDRRDDRSGNRQDRQDARQGNRDERQDRRRGNDSDQADTPNTTQTTQPPAAGSK